MKHLGQVNQKQPMSQTWNLNQIREDSELFFHCIHLRSVEFRFSIISLPEIFPAYHLYAGIIRQTKRNIIKAAFFV